MTERERFENVFLVPQGAEEAVIEKALRRAFNLGQTYLQQADSESYSQNRKSDETLQKFNTLVVETSSKFSGMEIVPVVGKDSFVQLVPDHCDRIVWRGSYHHLPLAATKEKGE